jgi:hypothetical protein
MKTTIAAELLYAIFTLDMPGALSNRTSTIRCRHRVHEHGRNGVRNTAAPGTTVAWLWLVLGLSGETLC